MNVIIIVIMTNVKAEAGSGKICLKAEAFLKNELEAESETINFFQSRKRKRKIIGARKRKQT